MTRTLYIATVYEETVSKSGTDSYMLGRAGPIGGPGVVSREVRRTETAPGEGTGKTGRPPPTGKIENR
jgi:hypothetical protein